MDKRILVGSALVFSLLSACGGGSTSGGGGAQPIPAPPPVPVPPPPPPPPPAPTAFSNFQSVPANGVVRLSGSTVEVRNSGYSYVVQNIGTPSGGSLALDLTYSSSNQTAIGAAGSLSTTTFNNTDGSTRTTSFSHPSVVTIKSRDLENILMIADPALSGYSYMTYGIWNNGDASGDGRGTTEIVSSTAFVGGSATPAASVPASGSATYTGTSVGIYTAGFNRQVFITSNVTLGVNFGTRSINYTATNSQGGAAAPKLDVTGVLTYNAGSSNFSGTLISSSANLAPFFLGTMTGTASGSFYGAAAQELGGLFALSAGSDIQYIGSFGGKRP